MFVLLPLRFLTVLYLENRVLIIMAATVFHVDIHCIVDFPDFNTMIIALLILKSLQI